MSITIARKLSVINGFVEVPNTKIASKTSLTVDDVLTAVSGTKRQQISGSRLHNMDFVEFPEYAVADGYPNDWFAILNDLV